MKTEIEISFYPVEVPEDATYTTYQVYIGPWHLGKLIEWPGKGCRFFGRWYGTMAKELRDYESREAFLTDLKTGGK